jgi:hypothetical protein
MLLQRLEVRAPIGEYEGDLAVDQGRLRRQRGERCRDRRKARRPVEPTPAEQRDVVADFSSDDAVAVIFDFVQPIRAGRYLGLKRRKFGLDEWRNR